MPGQESFVQGVPEMTIVAVYTEISIKFEQKRAVYETISTFLFVLNEMAQTHAAVTIDKKALKYVVTQKNESFTKINKNKLIIFHFQKKLPSH